MAVAVIGQGPVGPVGLLGQAGSRTAGAAQGVHQHRGSQDKTTGRADDQSDSFQLPVTSPEEVRPMNAVSLWVLPLPVTVGRLT
ncbi:hypothetical protein ACZ91_30550 [Streptomyces regensis]|nr:hypothetical protein ACZ91_30550 [Streptomyces regensis]KOG63477.1 hypothetical protein ADK77_23520 [Streptomyces antibioticus]